MDALKLLNLNTGFRWLEVDHPRMLEGGRRLKSGREGGIGRVASDQNVCDELSDKTSDLVRIEAGLGKGECV